MNSRPLPGERANRRPSFSKLSAFLAQSSLDCVGRKIVSTIKQACQCFSLSWGGGQGEGEPKSQIEQIPCFIHMRPRLRLLQHDSHGLMRLNLMSKPAKSQWDFGELFPAEQTRRVLSVSELTAQVKRLLEKSVGSVWVTGEVTNLRAQSSGHMYFTLKDAAAS